MRPSFKPEDYAKLTFLFIVGCVSLLARAQIKPRACRDKLTFFLFRGTLLGRGNAEGEWSSPDALQP